MGCPLCKNQAPATGVTAYDFVARKFSTPASRRVSVVSQPTWMNSHKGSIDSDSQPPIYFLSGSPALPVYATPPPDFRQPPKKAPRLSGFKEAHLTAVPELPSRPPRKLTNNKRLKLSLPTGNSLSPHEANMSRSASALSLPPDIILPEETAQRLENYLKKNQSFSSMQMLLSELQAQSHIDSAGLEYDTEEDDEQWSPTCLDLGGVQLPTSRRHSLDRTVLSPPILPSRKKRSLEHKSEDQSSAGEDSDTDIGNSCHWDDLESRTQRRTKGGLSPESATQMSPARSPSRLSPFDLRKFSNVEEEEEAETTVPTTPGPWFDRDGRNIPSPGALFKPRSRSSLDPEVRQEAMVTPPPSENDESDDEPVSPVIAHSILLKVLRGLSVEGANNSLVTRRGSAGNISLTGLGEFIRTVQQQPPEEEEDPDLQNSPSIADLQAALAELINSEKINEKLIEAAEGMLG